MDRGVDDLYKVGMVSRVGLQRVQGGEVLLRWSGTKWLRSGNVEVWWMVIEGGDLYIGQKEGLIGASPCERSSDTKWIFVLPRRRWWRILDKRSEARMPTFYIAAETMW